MSRSLRATGERRVRLITSLDFFGFSEFSSSGEAEFIITPHARYDCLHDCSDEAQCRQWPDYLSAYFWDNCDKSYVNK